MIDYKFKMAFLIGGWGAIILELLHKYVFADWAFLGFLGVLITIDTLSGMYAAWKLKKFSSSGMSKVVSKMIGYTTWLVGTHVLTHFNIVDKELLPTFSYIKYAVYCTIILIEYVSILENLHKIGIYIPNFIKKHLEDLKDDNKQLDRKTE